MGLLDDAIREHLDLKRKRGADPAEIEKLEREALGPVRREPVRGGGTGMPHLEVQTEPGAVAGAGRGAQIEEHPTELHTEPAEAPAPEHKRGFLRRSKPAPAEAPPTDFTQHLDDDFHGHPGLPEDPGFHSDQGFHDELATHEHAAPAAPTSGPEAEHEPPPLTFESGPPKRPTFSVEPPAEADEVEIVTGEPVLDHPAHTAEQVTEVHEVTDFEDHELEDHAAAAAAAPPPAHPAPAPAVPVHIDHEEAHHDDLGETREWDVEHAFAAEGADHSPDAPTSQDEDVLEETPEFLQDTPDHDRLWFEQRPPRDFDFDG